MAGKKGMKRSSSFVDDEDDEGVETAPVKTKKTKVADGEATAGKDDDGNPFWGVSLSVLYSITDHDDS